MLAGQFPRSEPLRFVVVALQKATSHVRLAREIAKDAQRVCGIARVQHLQKILEDANVKLTEAISDILGATGRAILQALIDGETDAERLADLSKGRLNASRGQLVDVLHGRVTAHHRFMLKLHLTHIEAIDQALTDLEAHIEEALAPFRAAIDLLITMPGLSTVADHRDRRRDRYRHDRVPHGGSSRVVGGPVSAAG